jgi:hypothetical protein
MLFMRLPKHHVNSVDLTIQKYIGNCLMVNHTVGSDHESYEVVIDKLASKLGSGSH